VLRPIRLDLQQCGTVGPEQTVASVLA
jgi:hypothetical protein